VKGKILILTRRAKYAKQSYSKSGFGGELGLDWAIKSFENIKTEQKIILSER
jgi:hypothetical protein